MRQTDTWITNSTFLTQDSRRSLVRGTVRIIDGRIAAIMRSRPKRLPRGARVIDASGLTVLPGFVQAHIHLCQTLFRNQADDMELLDWLSTRVWVMEAAHTSATLRVSADVGIHELLSSGTTCILDMGTVRHTHAILEAVRDSGIRASVGKCLMDHPATPRILRERTADALKEAISLYRRWNGAEGDRIRVSYAPRFVISCSEKLLREVASLSRAYDALVHTHASENRKEIALVKKMTGSENVEYLHRLGLTSENLVLAHCVWLTPREKRLLARTNTNVVHCPSSNLKLASGLARVPELRAAGVNVALGADGAPCNNSLNMFNEMRLAALIHKPGRGPKVMRAQEALDMATRNGARALKWFDDIGSIEVGKKADLVALDLNSLDNMAADLVGRSRPGAPGPDALASAIVYSSQPSHVRWTMVDGRLVYRDGQVRTINARKLRADLVRAQKIIAARLR